MRSLDGGNSWQRVADTLGYAVSVPYAISFFDNNIGIITTPGYAAKTVDAGITWIEIDDDLEVGTRDGDIGSSQYIGMDGRIIIISEDQGETFVRDTIDYQGTHYFLKAKDHRFISSAIGNDGQALGYPNNSFGIITRGNVVSREWKITYFPFLSRVFDLSWPSENVIYAVNNFYYTESPEEIKFFMKSIDGGETWYRQATIQPYYYGTQNIFCPSDSVCFAVGGNNAYIYKTTNGGGPLLDEVEQIVLSVKEIKDDLNFSIAPNPTKGRVTVTSEKEHIKEVKVFDLQGKELTKAYPNDFNVQIDLSKFESGVYLIQILAGNKIRTGKIIKK